FVYPDLKILLTDTVGFINKLPTELIEAFKATLEEIQEADIILHVVDASDPKWLEKIETVNDILKKLDLEDTKQILVFNKIDRLISSPEELSYLDHSMMVGKIPNVYVSAEKKWNIDQLLEKIRTLANQKREEENLSPQ
ncbi:MAG: GTPase, partial [Aquificota bacterium]